MVQWAKIGEAVSGFEACECIEILNRRRYKSAFFFMAKKGVIDPVNKYSLHIWVCT